MFSKAAWINLALACAFSWLCSSGCTPQEAVEPRDPQSLPPELQGLVDRYGDAIAQFPYHTEAEEILGQFLKAAEPLAKTAGQDPQMYLMYQFSSSNLGLYCLDRFLKSGNMAAPDTARAFCVEVQQKAPATPLAKAALSRELSLLAANDETGFRDRCNAILSATEKTAEMRIALYTRSQYYAEHNQSKAAALDLLKFWAWFPDQLKAMDAVDSTLATLNDAGYVLEASVLAATKDPARVAQCLLDEYGAASINDFEAACDHAPGAVGAYLRWSPDVAKFESLPAPAANEPTAGSEKALHCLRLACLYASRSRLEDVLGTYSLALQELAALAAEKSSDTGASFLLTECCWTAIETLRKMETYHSSMDEKKMSPQIKEFQVKSPKLASPLADSYLALALQASGGQEEGAAVFRQAVENYVNVALRLNDRKRAPRAYRLFVQSFPNSPASPEMLIALGDLFKSKYELPSQGTDAYREAIEKYPDSAQKATATWKLAVALYEMDKYPEAYEACLAILAEFPDSSQADSARLTSAFCEAAMGQPELAQQHLEEFCTAKPQSPMAPKALLLLATQILSAQDYEKAGAYLQDLTERYPETSEAVTAKEYLERLASIQKSGSGG